MDRGERYRGPYSATVSIERHDYNYSEILVPFYLPSNGSLDNSRSGNTIDCPNVVAHVYHRADQRRRNVRVPLSPTREHVPSSDTDYTTSFSMSLCDESAGVVDIPAAEHDVPGSIAVGEHKTLAPRDVDVGAGARSI